MNEKRRLSDDDITAFKDAADDQEPLIFQQLDALCGELMVRHPVKAAQARVHLRWLIKQGKRRGVKWVRR